MFPTLFKVFGVEVTSHGLFSLIGIILGGLIIHRLAKIKKLETKGFVDVLAIMSIAGFVGARLSYFIVYRNQFSGFLDILDFQDGGLISFGGFILGFLAFVTIIRRKKWPVLAWLNILAVGFLAGQFIGRMGDVLAGEYEGKFSENFPIFENTIPITLFEGMLCLILFLFFQYRIRYEKSAGVFFSALIAYLTGRLILDFWRAEVYYFSILSLGQTMSLFLILLSAIIFNINIKRRLDGTQPRVSK